MHSFSGWALLKAAGILLRLAFFIYDLKRKILVHFSCNLFPLNDVPAKEAFHSPYIVGILQVWVWGFLLSFFLPGELAVFQHWQRH